MARIKWLRLAFLLLFIATYIFFQRDGTTPPAIPRNLMHWSSASEPDEPFVGINFYTVDPSNPNVGIVLCRSYAEQSADFSEHIRQCQIDFTNAFRADSIEWFDGRGDFEWKNLGLEFVYLCKIKSENESLSIAYKADDFFEAARPQKPINPIVGRHYDAATQTYPMIDEHLKRIRGEHERGNATNGTGSFLTP